MHRLITKFLAFIVIGLLPYTLTLAKDGSLKSLQLINKTDATIVYLLSDVDGSLVDKTFMVDPRRRLSFPSLWLRMYQDSFIHIFVWKNHTGGKHDCGTAALVGKGQIIVGNDSRSSDGLSCQVIISP